MGTNITQLSMDYNTISYISAKDIVSFVPPSDNMGMGEIIYTTLKEFGIDAKSTHDLNHLLNQLSPSAEHKSAVYYQEMVDQSALTTFIAVVDEKIVGMASALVSINPFKKKVYFEDLVVDEDYRGRGIAKVLINQVIEHAKHHKASNIDMTSNPSRTEALNFYESLGFEKRDTNVYRLKVND